MNPVRFKDSGEGDSKTPSSLKFLARKCHFEKCLRNQMLDSLDSVRSVGINMISLHYDEVFFEIDPFLFRELAASRRTALSFEFCLYHTEDRWILAENDAPMAYRQVISRIFNSRRKAVTDATLIQTILKVNDLMRSWGNFELRRWGIRKSQTAIKLGGHVFVKDFGK